MFRRVFGALALASVLFVSREAVSGPTSSGVPTVRPVPAPAFLPGIAPAPGGATGHFVLQHREASALFSDTGVRMRLPTRGSRARELGWSVPGARVVTPRAEKPRGAKLHRLLGPLESWEPELPTYGGVRYPGVLPGVDLWFEEKAEGLEYGFRAERGADLRRVKLSYAGARAVRVVEQGRALEVVLEQGVLREQGLRCWQEVGGGVSRDVECRFAAARRVDGGRWEYAIEVDVQDPERPVVVDPLVLWNTYLGGPGDDALMAIAQNAAGDIFIVGTVGNGLTSPSDASRVGGPAGGSDVLVARFRRDGTLSWSTLLGGSGWEEGRAIAVGASDEVYVAGSTASVDLPGRLANGGAGSTLKGAADGFVARLSSNGKQLDWFLHVGGSSEDRITSMVRADSGLLFLAGETKSNDLPMPRGSVNPIDGWEGMAVLVDPGVPEVSWSVYIQAPGDESTWGIAYNGQSPGVVYVTGATQSLTGGRKDAFLATIVNANPSNATYLLPLLRLGGAGDDEGRALLLTPLESPSDVLVLGSTGSSDFPDAGHGDSLDVFVTVVGDWLASSTRMPVRKTVRVGGALDDELRTATLDSSGRIYVGGMTSSRDFPVTGGFDTNMASEDFVNGFVARLQLDQEPAVEWGSFVGGSELDEVLAVRADALSDQRLLIGGRTSSPDLKYSNSGYHPDAAGAPYDMFLLSVDLDALAEDGGSAGPDGGGGEPDAGPGAPDAGPGGPDAGPDGGVEEGPRSPLGWSCGATGGNGGTGALALVTFAGLGLFVSRRRKAASPRE